MPTDLSTPGRGARRIVPNATSEPAIRGAVIRRTVNGTDDAVVGSTFTAVCGTVLGACLLMAYLLSVRNERPIPAYAIFGSALFATVIAAFLAGCVHLAVTDGKRDRHDH